MPSRVVAVCLLLCLLLLVERGGAQIPEVPPQDPAKGIALPAVKVGIIKGHSCDPTYLVQPAMHVFIDADIYIDDGTPLKKAKPVLIFKRKRIHGVKRFNFIPGIELGIVGACAGEKRSIRFPAELGFPEGAKKYHIPPNTPLKAVVSIHGYFFVPEEEMEADKSFEDPDIKTITGGKSLKKEKYDRVKQVSTQKEFDSLVAGKTAVVFVYTTWCGPCAFAEEAMAEAADQLSGGLGGDTSQPVVVLGVDATRPTDAKFVESLGADGYPTILVRLPDGVQKQYYGARTAKDLIQFIEKEVASRAA